MTALLTIIALLLIFSIVVFIHEFGHFAAAKLSGVHVEEFSIGFGRKLFSKVYKGTDYQIRAIPLGGYVKLEGEERTDKDGKSKDSSFQEKSFPIKFFVFIAGIVMNIILAIVVFTIYLPSIDYKVELVDLVDHSFAGTESVESLYPMVILDFAEESAAREAGLQIEDRIVQVEGEYFQSVEEFQDLLYQNRGSTVEIGVYNIEVKEVLYTSVDLPEKEEAIMGVSITYFDYPFYLIEYRNNIVSAIAHTYNMFTYQFPAIGSLINRSFEESDPSYAAQSVNGVVGVSAVVNAFIIQEQFLMLLNLVGLISISLALFNILPIPILDGGQIAISALESIRGRKFSTKVIEMINFGSFVFVIILTIAITLKDIWQFEVVQSLIDNVRKIFGIY